MSPIAIAWRNIITRPVQAALTALIVALGWGLAIAVIVLSGGARRGLTSAGGPFELVIGPKGSATQLVVSSVLLQDLPIGNMPYPIYVQLRADPRVRDAVPIALGDNVQGLRIVGTTTQLFTVAVAIDRPPFYGISAGRPFESEREAVLGSAAAARLGLKLNDTFISSHGSLESADETHHDSAPYKIVGILTPTGTPADLGIYVPLQSYWHIHGISDAVAESATLSDAAIGGASPEALGVTAVLVRARDISSAYQLYQQINASRDVQAALPGAVLTQFLDLLGQGQRVLSLVAYVALVMAGLSVALTLYGAVLARQRDIAVLRALGASRGTILGVALLEALILGLLGLAGGALLGYAAAAIIASTLRYQSAVAISLGFEPALIPTALVLLGVGLAAGLAPALRAYRVDPAITLAQ
jgi:putative ABC transport system permease protein